MGCRRWLRPVLVAGVSALLVACSNGLPEPVAEGRVGEALRDEGCDGSLIASVNTTGVELLHETAGGSGSASVSPRGSDDPVWVAATIPCVDAPMMLFGGVDERADAVVVVRSDGAGFLPDLLELDDRSWRAVLGDFPPGWFVDGGFDMEVVAYADGEELGRDRVRGYTF